MDHLDFSVPRVMAVLNITPDSFSDGGRFFSPSGSIDFSYIRDIASSFIEQGAYILDVGGESTRPGAEPVSESEEMKRVLPVLEHLVDLPVFISVDTSCVALMQEALSMGVSIINDVRAFTREGALDVLSKHSDAYACVMHMQNNPQFMQDKPHYEQSIDIEITAFFHERIAACQEHGIQADRLLLDLGFGFGKTLAHNVELMRSISAFKQQFNLPILVGVSRKTMIGQLTSKPVENRLFGSLGALAYAYFQGAKIFRVHDIEASADVLKVLHALHVQEFSS